MGRVQNPTSFLIFTDDTNITNDNQIRDIKDRYGNFVSSGNYNIIGIRAHRGWSRLSHLTINAKKILD